jgi:hypothetical protein
VAQCIGELGIVAAASGEPERAARLFGAAAALREAIGGRLLPRNRAPLDDWTATARARLGERSFTRLWAVGRALAPDQAIDEALAESPAPMVVVDRSRFGKLVGGVS